MRSSKWLIFFTGAILSLFWACQRQPDQQPAPRLVVFLIVDQMRADYLDRFAGDFQAGFRRLLQNSTRFTRAYHAHAFTETAVGHATISTGCYPAHHGIVANNWYDHQARQVTYCTEDDQVQDLLNPAAPGQSPRRLMRPTLGDLLKEQSPGSKVYALALKDRAAILMGGKKADGAFWYDKKQGLITSSTYYFQQLPDWVQAFNQQRWIDRYFGQAWNRLRPEEEYNESREDDFPYEADGKHTTFPHRLGEQSDQPGESFYQAIYASPFGDELMLTFARHLVTSQQLGTDEHTDLLFVGCSAADVVGHIFGPYSQEVQDYYLRLDQYLGEFLSFLDETVGQENYVLILSADHGVLPLPEELARRGIEAGRVPEKPFKKKLREAIHAAWQPPAASDPVASLKGGISLEASALPRDSLARARLIEQIAQKVVTIHPVAATYWREALQAGKYKDQFALLFAQNLYPGRTPDLFVRLKKNHLVTRRLQGTTHGSPYEYDTHVPLLLMGKHLPAQQIDRRVRTIDIAPSVAQWLGLPATEMDGQTLFPER